MANKRLIWKDEFGDTHSVDEKINGKFVGDKDIREKLYEYEQEESEGRLINLPCKVGDTVFVVNGFKEIEELEVDYYVVEKNVISVGMVDDGEYEVETVFLTREEAEQALKEREKNG